MSEEIKSQGEPVAKLTLSELLADLPDGYSKDDVALGWHECVDNYTQADPAEVERLRAQLAELKEAFNESQEELVARGKKLAERDALLRKALADIEYIQKECSGDVSPGYIGCLVDDVVNLLSTSAGPKG